MQPTTISNGSTQATSRSDDAAFEILGIPLITSRRCSWENYKAYLEAIRAVQRYLTATGLDGVRLIDAHSFCWMLVKLDDPGAPERQSVPIAVFEPRANVPTASKGLGAPTEPDFEALERRRTWLGKQAEEIALEAERARLIEAGHADFAEKVVIVGADHTLGYDILSFEIDGSERLIEVKAARSSSSRLQFFLSENERSKAVTLPNYHFYLVIGVRGFIWQFAKRFRRPSSEAMV
ncbi:MAG: DUF3883 domain-containing protein [Verrucomicrobiales bacterium]|nr:DUF3883 domain-containing protein [Verrucomicrobiales bacterium]